IRAARARPTEKERPWPSAPAAFSTPGVVPSSGWPWRRLFSLRNVMSSATGKNPRSARAAYQTGHAWPLLRTNRSRSGHVGFDGSTRRTWKYRAVTMSQALIDPPGWPLCALCVIRMMCLRRVMAFFLRPALSSSDTSTTDRLAPAPARERSREGMRVLRTSLVARASQDSKRVSEQDRKDDGDQHEPRQRIADPRLQGEEHRGDETREDCQNREDQDRFVRPSVEAHGRTADGFGIPRHETASPGRRHECDGSD